MSGSSSPTPVIIMTDFPVSVVSRKSTFVSFLSVYLPVFFCCCAPPSLLNKTVESEKISPVRWRVLRKKGMREKKKSGARCDIQFTSVDITLTC